MQLTSSKYIGSIGLTVGQDHRCIPINSSMKSALINREKIQGLDTPKWHNSMTIIHASIYINILLQPLERCKHDRQSRFTQFLSNYWRSSQLKLGSNKISLNPILQILPPQNVAWNRMIFILRPLVTINPSLVGSLKRISPKVWLTS